MNAIKEMDKRFKESDSKISSLSEKIESINNKIEELISERTSLSESLVKEHSIKDQLEKFSVELHKFDGNLEMMNYLFLGFMMSNGIEASLEEEKPKTKQKRRRRSKEEITEFEKWSMAIHEACLGYSENHVLHKAYNRMRQVYGFCFEQEEKEYFEKFEAKPRNTMSLVYYVESTKPTYRNILISCIETIKKEMYGEEN